MTLTLTSWFGVGDDAGLNFRGIIIYYHAKYKWNSSNVLLIYIIAIQKRQNGLLYESAKFVISTSRSHAKVGAIQKNFLSVSASGQV